MAATKRNSLRINFGSRDPIDASLHEAVSSVARASACGRAAAAKRLMTLGMLLFNGYDPRLITDRLPKQKILWVDVIWSLMRDYAAGNPGRSPNSEPHQPPTGAGTQRKDPLQSRADSQSTPGRAEVEAEDIATSPDGSEPLAATPITRFDLQKLKFP